MSNVIPFKVKNRRHNTSVEWSLTDRGVRVVAECTDRMDIAIAFWMTDKQVDGLIKWLQEQKAMLPMQRAPL